MNHREYLAKIGSKGGSKNTEAQNQARAKNAKLGGWPKGRKRKKTKHNNAATPRLNRGQGG